MTVEQFMDLELKYGAKWVKAHFPRSYKYLKNNAIKNAG